MSSIFNSLGIAQQALWAQQKGLEVTQKNIANANSPGYSRERVSLTPGLPTGVDFSNGSSVQSFRNRFVDQRVSQELQRQGEFDSVTAGLQQVEAILNENGGQGLQASLSNFFNSFSSLANAPEDASSRQQVISRANTLAAEFRRVYDQVQTVQVSQDRAIEDTVAEINSLTSSIASLNAKVGTASATKADDEETFRDQRQQQLDRLAGLIDLTYFETESGSFTVMTKQGSLLVVENKNKNLETAGSPAGGGLEIRSEGVDITSKIESGKLKGLIEVRDTKISGYLATLDDMAATLIDRVNSQHALGSDLNGNPGGNLFAPFVPLIPGSDQGAARSMTVAITDTSEVAAASLTGGPGDNTNASLLAGIKDENLFSSGTATAHEFYAGLVFTVGTDLRSADDNLHTQDFLLAQLQNQRDAASGVNLDEEAINIIRYQKAYEANARFVSVIDSLSQELVRLLGR